MSSSTFSAAPGGRGFLGMGAAGVPMTLSWALSLSWSLHLITTALIIGKSFSFGRYSENLCISMVDSEAAEDAPFRIAQFLDVGFDGSRPVDAGCPVSRRLLSLNIHAQTLDETITFLSRQTLFSRRFSL